MPADATRWFTHISLRLPVIVLVLGFTAVPMELRPLEPSVIVSAFAIGADVLDIVANVFGYIPVGAVLCGLGRWPAIRGAFLISLLSELMQVFTKHRSPALIDVSTNVLGAFLGTLICAQWKNESIRVVASFPATLLSIVSAGTTLLLLDAQITPQRLEDFVTAMVAAPPWRPTNERGAGTTGQLEGLWTFDSVSHDVVRDESSNHLDGVLVNYPSLVPGVEGQSVVLNGIDQWLDLGDPVALRLTGSMTITAWINATTFPRDDAAIVSDHSGLGYQLDTTIDQGSRAIGFKMANASGKLMMRYGRTQLVTNRWYHVAGVYNAPAQTMNVYLNGRLDDGCLSGQVTTKQQPSGEKVFIGRRADHRGYEFAGAIDDVRIYSRALTGSEILEELSQAVPTYSNEWPEAMDSRHTTAIEACRSTDGFDPRLAGIIVGFGVLVAVAAIGVLPSLHIQVASALLSLAAGVLLLPWVAPIVPESFRWFAPVLTFAGGLSVVVSARGRRSEANSGDAAITR